ncbi:MAG: hypothetical protein NTV01_01855 [Bacteroidia bacterium]|nr:hypothetical protein [Bacteroidia bacterium]
MTFNIFEIPGLEDLQIDPPRVSYLRILQNPGQVAKHDEFSVGDIGSVFDHRTKEIIAKAVNDVATYTILILKIFTSWTVWNEETSTPVRVTYDKQKWDDGSYCNPNDFERIGDNPSVAQQADNYVCVTKDNFQRSAKGEEVLKPRIIAIAKNDSKESVIASDKLKLQIVKIMHTIAAETGEKPNLWDVPFNVTTCYMANVITKKNKKVSYYAINSITPVKDDDKPFIRLSAAITAPLKELYESDIAVMNKPLFSGQAQIVAPVAPGTVQNNNFTSAVPVPTPQPASPPAAAMFADTPPPPLPPAFEQSNVVVDANARF